MDTSRLANVIFDGGQKITQTQYQHICESIDTDLFTLNDYVLKYKLKESFIGKVPYLLKDGSKVLVSESFIQKINLLNIDRTELESFMSEDYSSFKQLVEVVTDGDNFNA